MRVIGMRPDKLAKRRTFAFVNDKWHYVGTNQYNKVKKGGNRADVYIKKYIEQKKTYNKKHEDDESKWF